MKLLMLFMTTAMVFGVTFDNVLADESSQPGLPEVSASTPGIYYGRRRGGVSRRRGRRGSSNRSSTYRKAAPFKKWSLPPEASAAELNTSHINDVLKRIDLTAEQKLKIAGIMIRVKERRQRLLQDQTAARAAYQQAQGYDDCVTAAGRVNAAAAAVNNFRPQSDFDAPLSGVLTLEQRKQYGKMI